MNAMDWLRHVQDKRAERRLGCCPGRTFGRESFVAYRRIEFREGWGPTIMDHNSHSVKYYGEREKDTLRAYLAQHAQSCPVADDLYPTGLCLPSSAKNTRESIVSVASSMTEALKGVVQ